MGRTKQLSSGLLLTEATLPGIATSHKLAFFVTPGTEWSPGVNKKQRPKVWEGRPEAEVAGLVLEHKPGHTSRAD